MSEKLQTIDKERMLISEKIKEQTELSIKRMQQAREESLKYDEMFLNEAENEQISSTVSEMTEEKNKEYDHLDAVAMQQIDRDVVVVCHGNKVQVTNVKGRLKSSRLAPAELQFPFRIEHIVCLPDSVLAFHSHGVQGKSFIDNQLTQDITDPSKAYRVLGSDRVIVLESRNCIASPSLDQLPPSYAAGNGQRFSNDASTSGAVSYSAATEAAVVWTNPNSSNLYILTGHESTM